MQKFYDIDSDEFQQVTAAAYTKARSNFKAEAFLELANDVRDMIYAQADIKDL